jgi:hypothetical protein
LVASLPTEPKVSGRNLGATNVSLEDRYEFGQTISIIPCISLTLSGYKIGYLRSGSVGNALAYGSKCPQ